MLTPLMVSLINLKYIRIFVSLNSCSWVGSRPLDLIFILSPRLRAIEIISYCCEIKIILIFCLRFLDI